MLSNHLFALRKISYYLARLPFVVSAVFVICLFSGCSKNKVVRNAAYWQEVEHLVWTAPDSVEAIWASFSVDSLPYAEQMRWHLMHEHALLRLRKPVSSDSVMPLVTDFFARADDDENLAKAFYVQGAGFFLQSRYFEAMASLKEAEARMDCLCDTLPYKSLIYICEGQVVETEQLYHIAHEAYQKALPYAQMTKDTFRIAFCHYNIARTGKEFVDSVATLHFAEALDLAAALRDTLLYCDMVVQQEGHREKIDSAYLYSVCKFLVDTMHRPFYADLVSEYLLRHDDIDGAATYLAIFATDTVKSDWCREQYAYLQSCLHARTGNYPLAFEQMRDLYNAVTAQMQRDAKSRTYLISRMYDVEREKNRNLQLEIARQRLWIAVGTAVFLLVLLVVVSVFVVRLMRARSARLQKEKELQQLKAETEQQLAQAKIEQLNGELEQRRLHMRFVLQQKIDLLRQLHQPAKGDMSQYPQWLQEWLGENAFVGTDGPDRLLSEFKDLYGDLLPSLKKRYRSLTERDLQYIALAVLGMSAGDIGYLLGITERTIWNRRQAIKDRTGVPDFDAWVLELRKRY